MTAVPVALTAVPVALPAPAAVPVPVVAPAPVDELSLHQHVSALLQGLSRLFGIGPAAAWLGRCHNLLLAESCDYPAGARPLRRSALNVDGTPVQVGFTLGGRGSRLQFLGEVGAAALSNPQRLATARDRLRRVAGLLGAESSLAQVESVTDELVPPADRELLAEHAGAIWLGAGCGPGGSPRMKLYCNARWGEQSGRWQRLESIVMRLGAGPEWRKLRALDDEGLEPLGVALSVSSTMAGRIYLSGYGIDWDRLEAFGRRFADVKFANQVSRLGARLLGDEYWWPARSVVWSFGIAGGRLADVKFELCAHCAFGTDLEARERCARWLCDNERAAELYSSAIDLLSPGGPDVARVALHSHVGVGSRGERTFYFNPSGGLCETTPA